MLPWRLPGMLTGHEESLRHRSSWLGESDSSDRCVCVRDTQKCWAKHLSLRNTLHAPTGAVTPFFSLTNAHSRSWNKQAVLIILKRIFFSSSSQRPVSLLSICLTSMKETFWATTADREWPRKFRNSKNVWKTDSTSARLSLKTQHLRYRDKPSVPVNLIQIRKCF